MKNLRLYFLALPLLMLSQGAWADGFSGGTGTSSDPYLISSVSDLQELSNLSNSDEPRGQVQTKFFRMTDDIDMTSVSNYAPICSASSNANAFTGTFDGGGHTISNLKISVLQGNTCHVGMFSLVFSGTIKNVILKDVTISDQSSTAVATGALVGRNGSSTVENCAVINLTLTRNAASSGTTTSGSVCGYMSQNASSKMIRCFTNYETLGGMAASLATRTNCYFGDDVTSKAASGELCYLLNGSSSESPAWYQTIGTDGYPVLDSTHGTVYQVGEYQCDGVTAKGSVSYSNTNSSVVDAHTYSDGLCSVCEASIDDSYLVDDKFPISTANQMKNFGKAVNNVNQSLSGYLTGILDMDGEAWTGMTGYKGTFDGGGFTISNLAAPLFINTANGAAIKNLTLEGTLTGGQYFAPFVTYCEGELSIDKCINKVSVTSTGVQVGGFIGYVAANASATITNSENQADITSSADQVAGFVGRLRTSANLTMTNCKNMGGVKGLRSVGGMWGQANNGGTVLLTLCSNTGNITTTQTSGDDSRGGGIVGFVYSADKVTIEKCWNEGAVTGVWKRSGGIVGSVNDGTVEINNCYNIGNVTENSAGRAILGYTASSNVSITNCWANATIQSKTFTTATYTNCYYTHIDADGTGVTKVTADQLASGEVCYKLGKDNGWRQTLDEMTYPKFGGEEVLYVGTVGYSTMYDADNDWKFTGDAQAYIGTAGSNYVRLTEIDDIPKGTAVLVKGTYYNKVATTATSNTEDNDLLGSDGSVSGGEGIYALAKKNDVVGFYPVAASVTIPAGKAYLEYTGSNSVKGFNFVFDGDDATGIGLTPDPSPVGEESIYNLAGQRMDNSQLKRGIYVVNGKKILK